MRKSVYKSKEGRDIVESSYRRKLAAHVSPKFEQLFISTKIARTHVLRFGDASKPPLVMIHGSASNSAVWLGAVSDFIDRFSVYCVDIPGEPGLSEPVRCVLRSDDPFAWLGSLLDTLGIEKASFITISLGSWYALNFAMRSPERVRALSMLTSPGIVPPKGSFILKALVFSMLGKTGQAALNRAIFHKAEAPAELLEFQSLVSRHFLPVLEAIPLFPDAELGKIAARVQFFGGDHDALIDSVKTGSRLKKLLADSEVRILNDTGHAIIDQFSAIKDFLLAG